MTATGLTTRYVALLRGVNISGKNRVVMDDLVAALTSQGFGQVVAYLNSGNLLFTISATDTSHLAEQIRAIIKKEFNVEVPVLVLKQESLKELIDQAPKWWGTGDKAVYHNLIFVLPPTSTNQIVEKIGAPSADLEQIDVNGPYIFWSFLRDSYAKANWWKKTAQVGIGENLTIRTANTLRKLVEK